MSKHVGIVACSAEGAALCYQTLCKEAPALMGDHMHPEISMHTHPLGEYMVHIRSGNWAGVAELMLSSVKKLADIGAEFAICPDNTIHQAFRYSCLEIADTVASHRRRGGRRGCMQGFHTLAITDEISDDRPGLSGCPSPIRG